MSLKLQKLWLLGLLLAGLSSATVRYDGYRVYSVTPANAVQLKELQMLDGVFDSIIFPHGIDGIDEKTNVVVAPHKVADFVQIMTDMAIKYELLSTNLQTKLQTNKEGSRSRSYASNKRNDKNNYSENSTPFDYDWNNYYSLETTHSFLKNLSKRFRLESDYYNVGPKANGSEMWVFEVKSNSGMDVDETPSIFIEAGIYGNEWIAPATATYIIKSLLTTEDLEIKNIVDKYNWYIMPFANPDGYKYSFTTDPLWRKNRSKHSKFCRGVDLNRNFKYHWNYDKSAHNPCSNIYSGPAAESEQETQVLTKFVKRISNLKLYISLQGYSQKLVYPYHVVMEYFQKEIDVKQVLAVSLDALKHRYGTNYTGGNMPYTMAGSSLDWAAATQTANMAFTYKLRPSTGSINNAIRRVSITQILPTAVETFDSLIAMARKVLILS